MQHVMMPASIIFQICAVYDSKNVQPNSVTSCICHLQTITSAFCCLKSAEKSLSKLVQVFDFRCSVCSLFCNRWFAAQGEGHNGQCCHHTHRDQQPLACVRPCTCRNKSGKDQGARQNTYATHLEQQLLYCALPQE